MLENMKKNKYSQVSHIRDQVLLRLIREVNLDDIICTNLDNNDKDILDIFCRSGSISLIIARRFSHARVVGMEEVPSLLKAAIGRKRRSYQNNLEFVSLSNLSLYPEQFDAVTLFFALNDKEPDYIKTLLKEIKTVLKVKGKLVIADFQGEDIKKANMFLGLYISMFYKKFSSIDIQNLLKDAGYINITSANQNGVTVINAINND